MTCVSLPYIYWYGQKNLYLWHINCESTYQSPQCELEFYINSASLSHHFQMFYLLLHFNIRFAVFCKKESRNYLLQALITNIEYAHIYFSKPFHPNKNLPKFFVVIFAVCTNLMKIYISSLRLLETAQGRVAIELLDR